MSRRLFLVACGCGVLSAPAATPTLAPPAEPPAPAAAASAPAAPDQGTTPAAASSASAQPAVANDSSAPFHHSESDVPDSIGAVTVRPVPEPSEDLPPFVQQANYLEQHHDDAMAADYLNKVALNPDVSSRDRARVILQLADCLQGTHRIGAELAWLKIWMQLYPSRPEVGAVAYRMGALYTEMGLSDLARDSYYLALSNAVNHGQVQDAADLAHYARLTTGTLWALAKNEYQSGDWARAAQLFDRYRHEAQSPSPESLARAEYLEADCSYQQRQGDTAMSMYQAALKEHPFHPLAPAARLRLYHLDLLAGHPEWAQQELEAMVWTVRTVWPKDEALWQQRTAELLLALNRKNLDTLPPLLAKSAKLSAQDKAWQAELGHYDRLANLEATTPQAGMAPSTSSSPATSAGAGLREQDDLAAMQHSIDALAPPRISDPGHP